MFSSIKKKLVLVVSFMLLSVISYAQTGVSVLTATSLNMGLYNSSGTQVWDTPEAVNIPVYITIENSKFTKIAFHMGDNSYTYIISDVLKTTQYPDSDGDYLVKFKAYDYYNSKYCTIRLYYKSTSDHYSYQLYFDYSWGSFVLKKFM